MKHPSGDPIRSADNTTVKKLRMLRSRKIREAERLFVLEGDRAIADAIAHGLTPVALLIRADVEPDDLPPAFAGIDFRFVEAKLFATLTDTQHPQGTLAIFPMPALEPDPSPAPLVLLLDGLADPGNLGTALRSACGAGATAVVVTEGTVDPWNAKAVRAGMGAHLRIPILAEESEAGQALLARCPLRVLAEASGDVPWDRVDWTGGVALIIGSEATGASPRWQHEASLRTSIPLAGDLESLNAGVAASVLLFEARRQRGAAPPKV